MLNVSDKLNIYYSMQLCFPILHFQLIGNTLYVHGSWFVFHSYACWSQCYKNKRPDLPSFRFSCNCCKAGLERSMEIRRRSGWWCRKANVNKPWPQKVSWNQWHYGSEIRSQRINRGGGLPLVGAKYTIWHDSISPSWNWVQNGRCQFPSSKNSPFHCRSKCLTFLSLPPNPPPKEKTHPFQPSTNVCVIFFLNRPFSAQGSQSTSSGPIDPIISSSWWITFSVEKRFGRKKPSGDNRTWKSSWSWRVSQVSWVFFGGTWHDLGPQFLCDLLLVDLLFEDL